MAKGRPGLIIGVILIAIILIGVVVVAAGGFGGNKVNIKGTAYYNAVTKWGISYNGYETREDSFFSLPFWYWPWTTRDVLVKVELWDINGNTYYGDIDVGTLSNIYETKDFVVELHHIPAGSYTGSIYLYEVDKDTGTSQQRVSCSIPSITVG